MEKTLKQLQSAIISNNVNNDLFKDFDNDYYNQKKAQIEILLKALALDLLKQLSHVPYVLNKEQTDVVVDGVHRDLSGLNIPGL
jgi:hypothetical protein